MSRLAGREARTITKQRLLLACLGIVAVAVLLRWPLAAVPLERDEGEYAYIAQRWLRGEVPYRDAFDQKPPGAFAAYALFFRLFGETIESIHWGTQLYTLGTLALIGVAGRRLFGTGAGLLAALLAAFLTADCCVLGNAANTETFMILPLTAAFLAALRAVARSSAGWAAVAGACGTLAMLCKQVALPNAVFHFLLLLAADRRRGTLQAAYVFGGLAAFAPVVGYFAAAGALREFWDCVFGHNLAYARRVPLYLYPGTFLGSFLPVLRQWWPILACAGFGLYTLDEAPASESPWLRPRRLAGLWLLASFAGVSIGGYYREHYYIQAIPPVAVLAGRGVILLARRWAPRRTALAATGLALAAVGYGVLISPWYYVYGTPLEKCRAVYGGNPFRESLVMAEYLARHSAPEDLVFVYGSEPQILFYADRTTACRYIFVYPLMTSFSDTLGRQERAFREVADNRPRWVVTINISASFLDDEQTPKFLEERIGELLHAGYRLVGTMEAEDTAVRLADEDRPRKWTFPPDIQHSVALWERRTEAPAESR